MAEPLPLDHVMLATPDLDATAMDIARQTGVQPTEGGRHVGQGTRNILLSLGPGSYLELIGPDPGQDQINNFGARLLRLPGPTVLMFGMRTSNIGAAYERATARGLWACAPNGERASGPIAMSRALPAGGLLAWQLLLLGSNVYDRGVPFFIQWEGAPHPSESSAAGCTLERFWVEHPDAGGLAELYAALAIPVDVVSCSGQPALKLTVKTPKGSVTL